MARPKEFFIGTYRFVVKWSNKKAEAHHGAGDTTAGVSFVGTQRVIMRTDMGHDVERETVLHEFLHQALGVVRLDLKENLEERVVGALAPQLLNFLRQNPELVEYVQETEPAP